ncbi:MAG: hypothetical protein GWP02_03715 [Desulfobulbaceae bacterium]|nr:hypothetical protein [Desulfobulbaceae bacterium]
MRNVARAALQVALYAGFAFVTGYLSFWPRYQYAAPDMATVKISLSHATNHVAPCVELTPQQIAELAPNMRRSQLCERKRLPLLLELDIDGELALRIEASPSGMWGDGNASVYERFDLAPGEHRIATRLRDTARSDGWDYSYEENVIFAAGRYRTITFKPEKGGFSIR